MTSSLLPVLVLLVPLFGALALPLLRIRGAWLVQPLALVAAGITSALAWAAGALVLRTGGPVVHRLGGWEPPWGIELRVDYLSAVMVVLITTLSFLVLLFGRRGLESVLESRRHYFDALYLLFTMGLCGVVLTGDLFNLYVFLEVSSLTAYALIGAGPGRAPFAAFRYLILGTVGGMFYLLGVAYLYGVTGSLNFLDVAERLVELRDSRTVLVALGFLLSGFALKAALFPLHAWLPDAYSYAPHMTVAFMGAVGTKVGAYGIFRVLYTVYDVGSHEQFRMVTDILGWLAAAAIVIGSVLAIAQTDLKRMLAYSSVSQIGYVVLGFSMVNAEGITGGVLHIVNHALMKCCLFMAAGLFALQAGRRDIGSFAGLGRKLPMPMAAFTIAALSMVGLPPTAGFFSKWYLVLGAVEADRWVFVAIILLSSLLNAIYFFRVLEQAYLRPAEVPVPSEPAPEVRPVPWSMAAPLAVTATAVLVLGLGSWSLVEHVLRFIVPAGLLR